jgi:peroxiredoxin
MLPHERSLVEKLKGRPFSIVAVNSDQTRERLKDVMAKENITWPQFFDGGSTNGPIATTWNVTGWPTLYLIDAKGVIRHKNLRDEAAMEKAIEALIEEAEKTDKADAPAK